MTPLKWFASLVVVLIGVGAFFFWPRTPSSIPTQSTAAPAVAAPSIPIPPEVVTFQKATPVKRVQEFYALESKRIGSVDPDPKLTEQRLELVAAELKPEEISWLQNEALKGKDGDGRFFAAYLLALNSSDEAVKALNQIAVSPVPASKNKANTELERVLRMQAAEGLGRGSAKNSNAKDALLDVVANQDDEIIRDRAFRALHEARTGKPVEAQDKAALEKVLYGK